MTEIRRVLKQAAWRLLLIDFLRNLSLTASAAVVVLIVTLIGQRVLGFIIEFPGEWARLGAGALGAAVVAALVWALVQRAKGIALARVVDERADLRESLSTAMYVSRSQDPWANVVMETARERAKRVDVRRAIPIVAPRLWFVPLALGLSMAILWFSLPNWDLLGKLAAQQEAERDQAEIQLVKADIKKNEEKLEELLKRAGVKLEEDEAGEEGKDAQAPQDPDEIRRAAIKKLTSMQDRLKSMQQGDDAQKMDALKQMMRQIKTPPGPAEKMSQMLAKGNFGQAQQELEKLAQQLQAGDMKPEDLAKLQQQMQQLAQQMQQLAEAKAGMEKQLEQAGMSPEQAKQAAADPEQLKKMLEQMENLTEEQKKKLEEMAKAMKEAAEQCEGMGEAMSQMAAGMSENGMSQEGMEGMENLAGQLSEMEMMESDMASMDAAMSEAMKQLAKLGSECNHGGEPGECNGSCGGECDGSCSGGEGEGEGSGTSPWRLGSSQSQGNGQGGPGQGGGLRNYDPVDAPVNIEKVKSPTKKTDGAIIGTRMVQGDQVRGESVAEFASVVESSRKTATESLEPMLVPRELHPAVKTYFGRLEARAKAVRAPANQLGGDGEEKKEEAKEEGK